MSGSMSGLGSGSETGTGTGTGIGTGSPARLRWACRRRRCRLAARASGSGCVLSSRGCGRGIGIGMGSGMGSGWVSGSVAWSRLIDIGSIENDDERIYEWWYGEIEVSDHGRRISALSLMRERKLDAQMNQAT